MRCLSIANELRKQGHECIFITADNLCKNILDDSNFESICINSVWNDLNCETEKMLQLISEEKLKLLLLDSYYVSEQYMSALNKAVKLAYIDDLNLFKYPCDILINYTNYHDKFNYAKRYPHTRLLLGCGYAPVREEFLNINKKRVEDEVKSILITSGGTDKYNMLKKLSELLRKNYTDITINIVCGKFNTHIDEIVALKNNNKSINVFVNINEMAELMRKADIAISAGGTTLYELCACGTPTICITTADNQINNAISFAENGALLYAGDISDSSIYENVLSCFHILADNKAVRASMSDIMQDMVDGNGAARIAAELINAC
jgi:UDP-2,4-diacetamido-2,4,6-trideoxy-beta-L-altropyranose hydrolase